MNEEEIKRLNELLNERTMKLMERESELADRFEELEAQKEELTAAVEELIEKTSCWQNETRNLTRFYTEPRTTLVRPWHPWWVC